MTFSWLSKSSPGGSKAFMEEPTFTLSISSSVVCGTGRALDCQVLTTLPGTSWSISIQTLHKSLPQHSLTVQSSTGLQRFHCSPTERTKIRRLDTSQTRETKHSSLEQFVDVVGWRWRQAGWVGAGVRTTYHRWGSQGWAPRKGNPEVSLEGWVGISQDIPSKADSQVCGCGQCCWRVRHSYPLGRRQAAAPGSWSWKVLCAVMAAWAPSCRKWSIRRAF